MQFQFLIGTIKSTSRLALSSVASSVSIPYRYDKIDGTACFPNSKRSVSIPYRYDKIRHKCKLYNKRCYKFQFLIGTIKSHNLNLDWILQTVFQFLIGTIKSSLYQSVISSILVFQFLIGTIKSIQLVLLSVLLLNVSIPYRYDKIPKIASVVVAFSGGFNSL